MNKYEEAFSQFAISKNESAIREKIGKILEKTEENSHKEVLKFLYSCIDLTTLNTEDNKESIWKFVEKVNEFDGSREDMKNVAAICVYPNFVATVKEALTADVKIASVAGGFPASQTFTEIKIAETALAVSDGADEIDMVLNCGDFFSGNYEDLSFEIQELKEACREAKLKVILETGLLKSVENIQKATILSIYSGADFIKTSTGKGYPGASPKAAYVICETVKKYHEIHNRKIGIKFSGGIRTVEDALTYYTITKEVLGKEWLTPDLFRIGASSLTDNLLKEIACHF